MLQAQSGPDDDPIFACFEDAFAVLEFTFQVADVAEVNPVEKTNPSNALLHGMAVGSGVAVNRPAHPAGNAGHGFETPQTELNGQIDHLLKGYPSLRRNHSALDVYPIGGEAQNGSGKSVIGGDKIGASADERVRYSGLAQNGYGGGEGFLG